MEKFFILTNGRTGSTAVVDELNNLNTLSVAQELFLDFDNYPKLREGIPQYYKLIEPFDVWKQIPDNRLLLLYSKFGFRSQQIKLADRYLANAERLSQEEKSIGFGFKVLTHHFEERPFLLDLLANRQYKAVYLMRNNIVRTIVSGMIANQRGIYNSEVCTTEKESYCIDLDEFEQRVVIERHSNENNMKILRKREFKILQVKYEEFCNNRIAFYKKILSFLNIPFQSPPHSKFRVMIRDIRHVISNYHEFEKKVIDMGIEKYLEK